MIVEAHKKKINKDIEKLPKYAKEEAAKQIEVLLKAEKLSDVPHVIPMEGTNEPYFRLKFGDYRMMFYYREEKETITILSISHRKDAYKRYKLPWNQ